MPPVVLSDHCWARDGRDAYRLVDGDAGARRVDGDASVPDSSSRVLPPRVAARPRVAHHEGDRDARVDPSDVMEWDVVLFADEDGEWCLGKVETFRAGDDACVCQPLYEEASTGLWLESHARPPRSVRLADVRAVVEADFAQRMAPDRVSNRTANTPRISGTSSTPRASRPTRDASSR